MFPNLHFTVATCVQSDLTFAPDSAKSQGYRRLFARYQDEGNFLNLSHENSAQRISDHALSARKHAEIERVLQCVQTLRARVR